MLAVMLVASLLCVVGFARQGRTHWEYHMACGRPELNKLGEEGWELTAATQDGNVACLYFKRRK